MLHALGILFRILVTDLNCWSFGCIATVDAPSVAPVLKVLTGDGADNRRRLAGGLLEPGHQLLVGT